MNGFRPSAGTEVEGRDELVLALPGSPHSHGREAMLRHYAEYARQIRTERFEEHDHTVDVVGEVAMVA
jgi:hypothetical protein